MAGAHSLEWLRPSAIEGMLRVRREMSVTGDSLQIVERRLTTVYATSGMDWGVMRAMLAIFPSGPSHLSGTYREVIDAVARQLSPTWLGSLPRGRSFLMDSLGADVLECFRRSGALDASPEKEVVQWLDSLAMLARNERDSQLLETGREGERLSLDLEIRRCQAFADAPKVEWVALNDNTAGYDIRSSVITGEGIKSKFIEVKATTTGRKEFFLTRHEWEVARRVGNAYCVHLWNLNTSQLDELNFAELSLHIPIDQGNGFWASTRISLK